MFLNFLILFALCIGSTEGNDPCNSEVYKNLPRANYRGGKCDYNQDKPVCDRNLAPGWYRARHEETDVLIQTTLPDPLTCGTTFPYWMNGTLPNSVADGEVMRTVCQYSPPSNCSKTIDVRVKNCGSFFVYELSPLDSCDEAYCFGEEDECPPFDPCDIYEHTKLDFDSDTSGGNCSSLSDTCNPFDQGSWYYFEGTSPISWLKSSSSDCSVGGSMFVNESATFPNGTIVHTICHSGEGNDCSSVLYVSEKQCSGVASVYHMPDLNNIDCNIYCIDNGTETWFTCQVVDEDPGNSACGLFGRILLVLVNTLLSHMVNKI